MKIFLHALAFFKLNVYLCVYKWQTGRARGLWHTVWGTYASHIFYFKPALDSCLDTHCLHKRAFALRIEPTLHHHDKRVEKSAASNTSPVQLF